MDGIDIIQLQETPEERNHDFSPKTFEQYLGQAQLKEKLALYTQAALMRQEHLDHMLLSGPPGLGKTTLATIMADVMSVGIKICSGPMMERTGDLVAILSSLEPRDILFIDEIHRMSSSVEEVLYSAMEQFRVDVIIGQGAGAKSITLPINPFTLIGATTKSGMISAPLRSRFGINERLDFYSEDDLSLIILQTAEFFNFPLEYDAALLIAQASRGTPRIAKKLLRRVRDFAQVKSRPGDKELAHDALSFLGINSDGLTIMDTLILKTILQMFRGGPVGLETLAAAIGEDAETIETVYEPFLMRKGFIEKTARGRQIVPCQILSLRKQFCGQETVY